MIKKAEIVIEKFNRGITVRWSDTDGVQKPSKDLAPVGVECSVIGNNIWNDVFDIFNESLTDKVRIKLEYIPVEE